MSSDIMEKQWAGDEWIHGNKHLYGRAILKIFTADECADIIKNALNNWHEEGGTIGNAVKDLDWRNTTIFFPPKDDQKAVWCQKIINTITSFNNAEESYKFDLAGMIELPAMMRYLAPDINPNKKAGKYDWHMDLGSKPIQSMRKLSYSILLNVGEYEGGEMEFHIGKNSDIFPGPTQPDALGSMILFPSYLIHRIRPITKGTRYAIVGWMHGDSFR